MAFELRLDESGVSRECLDSPVALGANESKTFYIDFATWGATAADPPVDATVVVTILDQDGTTVTGTVLNSCTISGDTQVHVNLHAVTNGTRYQVFVRTTFGGETLEPWFYVDGEA